MDTSHRKDLLSRANEERLLHKQGQWLFSFNLLMVKDRIEINPASFAEAIIRYRPLSLCKPETIGANIKRTAAMLNITKQRFLDAALKQPALFCLKSETIDANIKRNAPLFGFSREKFISVALKSPQLFYLASRTLADNAVRSAVLLGVDREKIMTAAARQPQLLYQSPETINANVERSAALLGIAKQAFINAAFKHPQLFCQKPKTINANVEQSATELGFTKEELVAIAQKQPSLFYQKPETLKTKLPYIRKIAKALETSLPFPDLVRLYPAVLSCSEAHLSSCYLIAKHKLKRGSKYMPKHSVFSTLIMLSIAKRTTLLTRYFTDKIEDSERRNRILQRLHSRGFIMLLPIGKDVYSEETA